jgi:hypothetical protein
MAQAIRVKRPGRISIRPIVVIRLEPLMTEEAKAMSILWIVLIVVLVLVLLGFFGRGRF